MTTAKEVARETRFDGVRVRYDSDKGYDELLAARMLADIGDQPVLINDIAASTGTGIPTRSGSNPTSDQADSCCSR